MTSIQSHTSPIRSRPSSTVTRSAQSRISCHGGSERRQAQPHRGLAKRLLITAPILPFETGRRECGPARGAGSPFGGSYLAPFYRIALGTYNVDTTWRNADRLSHGSRLRPLRRRRFRP